MHLGGVRKARAQLKLKYARAARRTSVAMLAEQGKCGPITSGAGNSVTADPGKSEVLGANFASMLSKRVEEGDELSAVGED